MIKVKTPDGEIVGGLVKNSIGSLTVTPSAEYQRYISQIETHRKMADMASEVDQLKSTLNQVLDLLSKTSPAINKDNSLFHTKRDDK